MSGEFIPYIEEYGLDTFILSIDTGRLKNDILYRDAVDASILLSLDESLDAFTKLYLLFYYSSLVYLHEVSSVDVDANLLNVGTQILSIFFDNTYDGGMTPLPDIVKFFTGAYGDFVLVLGESAFDF